MDYFLWGQLKEHVYAVPPKTIEDLVERLQAVVTVINQHVKACLRE
jgi:hypothetical protein